MQMHKYLKKWLYEKSPNVPIFLAGDLDVTPSIDNGTSLKSNMLISKLMESMFVDLGNLANPQGPKYSLQTQQIPFPDEEGITHRTVDYMFVLKHFTDDTTNNSEVEKNDLNVEKSKETISKVTVLQ